MTDFTTNGDQNKVTEKQNKVTGKGSKRDVKLRLDYQFIEELDAIASEINLSRNAIICLLIREGLKYSSLVNDRNPS